MANLNYMRQEATTASSYLGINTAVIDAAKLNERLGQATGAEVSLGDSNVTDLLASTNETSTRSFGEFHNKMKLTIGTDSVFGTQYNGYFTDPGLDRHGAITEHVMAPSVQNGWLLVSVEIPAHLHCIAEVGGNLRIVIREGASGTDNISTDGSSQNWTDFRFFDPSDDSTVTATKSYGSWNSSGKYWTWHSSIQPFAATSGTRYVEVN